MWFQWCIHTHERTIVVPNTSAQDAAPNNRNKKVMFKNCVA